MGKDFKTGLKALVFITCMIILFCTFTQFVSFIGTLFMLLLPILIPIVVICAVIAGCVYLCKSLGWAINKTKNRSN